MNVKSFFSRFRDWFSVVLITLQDPLVFIMLNRVFSQPRRGHRACYKEENTHLERKFIQPVLFFRRMTLYIMKMIIGQVTPLIAPIQLSFKFNDQ